MKNYIVTFEIHEHDESGKYSGLVETKINTFHNDKLVDVYSLGCTNTNEMRQMRLTEIKSEIESPNYLDTKCLKPYIFEKNGRLRFHRITKIEIS